MPDPFDFAFLSFSGLSFTKPLTDFRGRINIQTTCDFRQLRKKEKQITAAVTMDYTELAA